jgi:hypothetical protein
MVVPVSGSLNWQLVDSNWLIVELLIVGPISNISTGYRVLSGICIGIGGIGGIGNRQLLSSHYDWLIVELINKLVNPYPYPISQQGPQRHRHRWHQQSAALAIGGIGNRRHRQSAASAIGNWQLAIRILLSGGNM